MPTKDQEHWGDLLYFVLGNEFDVVCCWFEDTSGRQIPGMANRIGDVDNIPMNVNRLRIDGAIWARSGDSFDQGIHKMCEALANKPQYTAKIVGNKLYIQLAAENAEPECGALGPDFSRPLVALGLTFLGAVICCLLCSFGYLAIVILLESKFCPPLNPQGNFGQFGFHVAIFGIVGLFYGASFGLIPYVPYWAWLILFSLLLVFTLPMDVWTDPLDVHLFAMLVVATLIATLGLITSILVRLFESRAMRDAVMTSNAG